MDETDSSLACIETWNSHVYEFFIEDGSFKDLISDQIRIIVAQKGLIIIIEFPILRMSPGGC